MEERASSISRCALSFRSVSSQGISVLQLIKLLDALLRQPLQFAVIKQNSPADVMQDTRNEMMSQP